MERPDVEKVLEALLDATEAVRVATAAALRLDPSATPPEDPARAVLRAVLDCCDFDASPPKVVCYLTAHRMQGLVLTPDISAALRTARDVMEGESSQEG